MSMLLDTNVVSELIRKSPAPAVATWVSDHPLEDLLKRSTGTWMDQAWSLALLGLLG